MHYDLSMKCQHYEIVSPNYGISRNYEISHNYETKVEM